MSTRRAALLLLLPALSGAHGGHAVRPAAFRAAPSSALLPSARVALAPPAPAPAELHVRAGVLIDGTGAAPLEGGELLIRGGRVAEIGRRLSPSPGAASLDLREHAVLPGLIDLHTHLLDTPALSEDPASIPRRDLAATLFDGRLNAQDTLMAGFTSARDVGTWLGFSDRALAAEIAAGRALGPRMQFPGYYLTVPRGGGDVVVPGLREEEIGPEYRMGVARGPRGFAEKAAAAAAGGATLIKAIVSGAVTTHDGDPGASELSPAEIAAAAGAAHRAGLRLAAHAHGPQAIKDALRAGADTIEHATMADAEALRLARERGAAFVMDLYVDEYIEREGRLHGVPEEFLRKNRDTMQQHRDSFRAALRAGVPLGFGTDAAIFPHGSNARQFRLMTELGMSPAQAIASATSVAARVMGWRDRVGILRPGYLADLIAARGNPLKDVATLEDVKVVIQGGRIVKTDVPARRR